MASGDPSTNGEPDAIGTTGAPLDAAAALVAQVRALPVLPASTPGVTMPIEFVRDDRGFIVRDRRYAVRAERQKAKRQRMLREKAERVSKENAVMAIAAGGANWSSIARELGISRTYARDLYYRGMERVGRESTEDFVREMEHRHAVLLQSAWTAALGGSHEDRIDALRIMDQWTKLRGAYPAAQVDLVGDVTVRREVSVREAMHLAAEIQADRILAGEAAMPAFLVGELPAAAESGTNGNGYMPTDA